MNFQGPYYSFSEIQEMMKATSDGRWKPLSEGSNVLRFQAKSGAMLDYYRGIGAHTIKGRSANAFRQRFTEVRKLFAAQALAAESARRKPCESVKVEKKVTNDHTPWSVVKFGRWKGKTLPQIIVADPDWFFWSMETRIWSGKYAREAETLERRARSIWLPDGFGSDNLIRYWFTPEGSFERFDIVEASRPKHSGSGIEVRRRCLNLAYLRKRRVYDKRGGKKLIKGFKRFWFNGGSLTKARVEAFFGDETRFANP